jgi:DNA-binding NtrC family response regulator
MKEQGSDRSGVIESTAREEALSTREVLGAELAVTRGPDQGQRCRLEEPTLTVGTGPLCGLRLSDPTVSREHLRLELGPKGLVVHDGGSKNGTSIGAVRVHRATLTGDASLKLGATTIAVTLDTRPIEILVTEGDRFGGAHAQSLPMRHVFALLHRAAPSEISVLLEGESGVGKELIARAIHEHSSRRGGPFVTIDCGAIPPTLIESELFGHERGAFTGADRARVGLFQQAEGGTVFLDELGELPVEMQPKLLRVLEQREVRAVGGSKAHPIDVRVVAATNQNLKDRCAEGAFREDLFYRIAALRVRVPSLRERPDDIVPLATRFLQELTADPRAQMPADILSMLSAYGWPGNVRELRSVVSRFALLEARGRRELFDDTGSVRRDALAATQEDLSMMSFQDARQLVLERLETTYFPAVLKRAGGVVTRAAELSGIARSSFYRMLERHANLRSDDESD